MTFKDYDKYLSTSLKVYLFVLVCIFIMKLIGLNYFGLDLDNTYVIKIADIITANKVINNIFYFIPLIIYQYIILTIICEDNSKKIKIYNLLCLPVMYFLEAYKYNLFGNFAGLIEIIYFLIICLVYCKINNKEFSFKKFIGIILLFILIQLISTLSRYRYSIKYVKNPIANLILNLDYILSMIIIYKIKFMKGENRLWTDGFLEEVSSFSLKKMNLKNLLKKLQRNWHNFNKQDKVTKLTFIIYFILSLIWNVFSVVLILLVAMLNDTFVECIFILTSFWLSKRSFGKAFHFSSMIHCFIVSNLSYYVLNRITAPLGISIIVPILLGVGLSYITSKFVKKTYKPLYRGMPEELFEETILKVADKDSLKYKICYDFYINKKVLFHYL